LGGEVAVGDFAGERRKTERDHEISEFRVQISEFRGNLKSEV
jgi:hypothetical protein